MSKPLILVVDDEPDVLAVLQLMLEQKGYDVAAAGSGADALAVLSERAPALLITDLRMPRLDGIGLLTLIREQNHQLPCIVLTAAGDIASAVRAMQGGADDFLCKPIDVAALQMSVERALQGPALRTAHSLRPSEGTPVFDGICVPGASMDEIERYVITKTLQVVGGSTVRAAQILNVSVRKIQYRLREYRTVSPAKVGS